MAANIHTTSANVVTLVWGSLRLTPIITWDCKYVPQCSLISSNIYTAIICTLHTVWENCRYWQLHIKVYIPTQKPFTVVFQLEWVYEAAVHWRVFSGGHKIGGFLASFPGGLQTEYASNQKLDSENTWEWGYRVLRLGFWDSGWNVSSYTAYRLFGSIQTQWTESIYSKMWEQGYFSPHSKFCKHACMHLHKNTKHSSNNLTDYTLSLLEFN